jgi:hypothetical protein
VDLDNLTMRPIAGREELGLFNQLPYVLNEEFAGWVNFGREIKMTWS